MGPFKTPKGHLDDIGKHGMRSSFRVTTKLCPHPLRELVVLVRADLCVLSTLAPVQYHDESAAHFESLIGVKGSYIFCGAAQRLFLGVTALRLQFLDKCVLSSTVVTPGNWWHFFSKDRFTTCIHVFQCLNTKPGQRATWGTV